jgi:hypothetical protein
LWNRRADALDVGENLAAEAAAKKESRESERKREREIKWTDAQATSRDNVFSVHRGVEMS